MNFYELDAPSYASDAAMTKANPAQYLSTTSLPGVVCEMCGEQWAGSDRVRVDSQTQTLISNILSDAGLGSFISIPFDDFLKIRDVISASTGLQEEILSPGAIIGPPEGEIRNDKLHDFIHPFPGMIWVKEGVKMAFEDAEITGCSFEKVQLRWAGKMKKSVEPLPDLWEFIVRSRAWRRGKTLHLSMVCSKCGRTSFHDPEYLFIDEERWDGSDVMSPDNNPNIVIITEKVKVVLDENEFTNYVCRPIV